MLLAVVIALEWYAHIAAPGTSAPRPVQAVTAVPAPSGKPVVYVPVATPAHGSSPATTPIPSTPAPVEPKRGAPIASPQAAPRIIAMSLSSPVVSGGEIVHGTVQTSSNVASVEVRLAGYSMSLPKVGVGKFALSYKVPSLPPMLHRTYDILVIARNAEGDATSSVVPLTIR